MEQEQKDEVVAFAKQQFAFLKSDKGFIRRLLHRSLFDPIVFRNVDIGIGIMCDFMNRRMSMIVGKLNAENKLRLVSEGRRRDVWSLGSLLETVFHSQDRRITELDQLNKAPGEWDISQWKSLVEQYRAVLYDYIDTILQQSLDDLFPTTLAYLSMYGARAELEQLALAEFTFLLVYGFKAQPISDRDAFITHLTWLSADRGVGIALDFRDAYVDCAFVKLHNGKMPTYDGRRRTYGDMLKGERIRMPIEKFLEFHHIHDEELDEIPRINKRLRDYHDYNYTFASNLILRYSHVVQKHIVMLTRVSINDLFEESEKR